MQDEFCGLRIHEVHENCYLNKYRIMNNYRKKRIEIAVDERLKHFARHIAWVATGGLQDDISPLGWFCNFIDINMNMKNRYRLCQ